MKRAAAAASLPDVLTTLKQHVQADMDEDDVSAQEVVEYLDLAWCVAERWRLEQYEMDAIEKQLAEEPPHVSVAFGLHS